VAAAFAMNPLTARSVLYVSARPDLVCAAGTLCVLMLARRARERGGAAAIAAVVVALVTLTATPWGFGATHGPPRFYMTTAVVLFLAGWLARPLLARSRAARVAGVLAIAALVFATRHVLPRWEDPVGLWSAEVARTPDAWDAHLGAADALREAAHCPEASAEYRVALRLKSDLDAARTGLARCRE
jgi:hypothetical protein